MDFSGHLMDKKIASSISYVILLSIISVFATSWMESSPACACVSTSPCSVVRTRAPVRRCCVSAPALVQRRQQDGTRHDRLHDMYPHSFDQRSGLAFFSVFGAGIFPSPVAFLVLVFGGSSSSSSSSRQMRRHRSLHRPKLCQSVPKVNTKKRRTTFWERACRCDTAHMEKGRGEGSRENGRKKRGRVWGRYGVLDGLLKGEDWEREWDYTCTHTHTNKHWERESWRQRRFKQISKIESCIWWDWITASYDGWFIIRPPCNSSTFTRLG